MFYTIEGIIAHKGDTFAVIETGGIGYKVLMGREAVRRMPGTGARVRCFTSLRMHDEEFSLYGFPDEPAQKLFELLTSVPGVGPKSALSLLDLDTTERLTAAILEKKTELLTRAPGIGKKTAERVVVELQNKLELPHAAGIAARMDMAVEVEEALVGLGYQQGEAKRAVAAVERKEASFEEYFRAALKILGKGKQ